MKILVTGSAGFIARFLVPALAAQGHSVVGIDKRKGPEFGAFFHFVHANILDREAVARAMQGIDLVIHLAAEHKDFGVPEDLFYKVNVEGTKNLLAHASKCGVNQFIFYSSVAVYGDALEPTSETLQPRPESPYGKSKLGAEELLTKWSSEVEGRQAISVRPTVVFGPYNFANMYRLIQSIAKHQYIRVGAGDNVKSVAYVENLVAATLYLMPRMRDGSQVFNYADMPHLTTHDLVAGIAERLDMRLPLVRLPRILAMACAFPFDIAAKLTGMDFPITAKRIRKFTQPTQHDAKKILDDGFAAPYTLDAAIEKTVAWYKEDHSSVSKEDLGQDTIQM